MMIKITIILWILAAVFFFAFKIAAYSMSSLDRLVARTYDMYPKSVLITGAIWLLLTLASVVMTIITIIMF